MCLYTSARRMTQEELHDLYILYLRVADPTEYRFAVRAYGDWTSWESAIAKEPIKSLVDKWRRELEVKLRSEALQRIMDVAGNEGTRDSLQANKYLLEANFSNKNKAGRPSKESVAKEAQKLMDSQRSIEEDYKRLFNGNSN